MRKINWFGLIGIALALSACNCKSNNSATTGESTLKTDTVEQILPLGPIAGTVMTKEYVYEMGKFMYLWGWPLVNMHNRVGAMRQVPEPGLNGGIVPVAPVNHLSMLTDYIKPGERYVACPNQDVAYGFGIMMLNESPVILQVPDFGDRFWVFQIGNQRTDGIGKVGKMYNSKPGFYMIVAPDWNGETPKGVVEVIRSNTNQAYIIPRLFLNNTPEDRAAIQPLVNQIMAYPLDKFTGEMQTTDWSKAPSFPDPANSGNKGEIKWVVTEKFFDELPLIMKEVPPMKGEEALYALFNSILDAAKNDPVLKDALNKAAIDADKNLVTPLHQFANVGIPIANNWRTPKNGANFGTDYLTRTAVGNSNIFVNQSNETSYFYQDFDSKGNRLEGKNKYTITFAKGEIPPVKGFWSLTMYNKEHFFYENPRGVYSLGTKNKDLQYAADGSLTIYIQHTSPGADKESNWLPAPSDEFSVYLRAYWPEDAVLNGSWTPPAVLKVQ